MPKKRPIAVAEKSADGVAQPDLSAGGANSCGKPVEQVEGIKGRVGHQESPLQRGRQRGLAGEGRTWADLFHFQPQGAAPAEPILNVLGVVRRHVDEQPRGVFDTVGGDSAQHTILDGALLG